MQILIMSLDFVTILWTAALTLPVKLINRP